MYIAILDLSSHNVLKLRKLTIVKNKSKQKYQYRYSGGGVELEFNIATSDNSIKFYKCDFTGNEAMLGGGVGSS